MNTTPAANPSKRPLVTILTIILVAAVAGLILYNRLSFRRNVHPVIQQHVAEIADALKARGVSVGEPQVLEDIDGAEQVVALDVNGKAIRLVELDVSKEKSQQEVAHIRQQHATKALGPAQPADVEGVIVILDFDKHPDREKIIEAFHKAAAGKK